MPTVATLRAIVDADTSGFEAGMRRSEKALDDFARGAKEKGERASKALSAALSKVDADKLKSTGQNLTVGVTLPLLAAGAASIKFASDVNESQSKVRAVFGQSAASIEKWSNSAAVALGQSRQEALEAAGTLGNLFTSMGVGQGKAAEMSKRLVQLSTDLGSFNNVAAGEAMVALRAGLVGESEPLRRFGVNLNEAALQSEALRLGLIRSTKDGLEPAAKAQAAYSLIFQQSKNAQGDFARTSGEFAGTLKKLEAGIKDEAAALGEQLLPVAKDLLKVGGDMLRLFNALPEPMKRLGLEAAITAAAMGPLIQGGAALFGVGKTIVGLGKAGKAAAAVTAATGAAEVAGGVGSAALGGGGAVAAAKAMLAKQAGGAAFGSAAILKPHEALKAGLGKSVAQRLAVEMFLGEAGGAAAAGGGGAAAASGGGAAAGGGLAAALMGPALLALLVGGGAAVIGKSAIDAGTARDQALGSDRDLADLRKRNALGARASDLRSRIAMVKSLPQANTEGGRARIAELEKELAAVRAEGQRAAGGRAMSPESAAAAQKVVNDPEDVLAARDATFAAEKARAGVLLATGDEETKAAREAAVMVPILKRQREDLLKRAEELKPQVGENAKLQKEYQNLLADIAQTEEEAARLQGAAAKERQERQKKLLDLGRELRASTFEGRKEAIQAGLIGAPEGQKAQRTAGAMLGLLGGRQQELVAEAQSLTTAARTDPEAQKRLLELNREWWSLQADAQQLRAAAAKEQRDNAKKALDAGREAWEASVKAQERALDAQLVLIEDGEKAAAAQALKLPFLARVQADLAAGLASLKPGTEAYYQRQDEILKLEVEKNKLREDAIDEERANTKKATANARKVAADQAEVLELKSKLLKAQIDNNPLLGGRQKQELLLGAQLQQYRQAMTAVQGETEKEKLQRLIGAENLTGDILKSAGGFKRTLGGGMAFAGNRRLLMALNREMLSIGTGAQGSAAPGGTPRGGGSSLLAVGGTGFQALPGETAADFIRRRDGYAAADLLPGATQVHDARARGLHPNLTAAARSGDQWLTGLSVPTPPAPRSAPTVPKPAGGTQLVFNLPPGMSQQQQLDFIRKQLEQQDRQYYAHAPGEE